MSIVSETLRKAVVRAHQHLRAAEVVPRNVIINRLVLHRRYGTDYSQTTTPNHSSPSLESQYVHEQLPFATKSSSPTSLPTKASVGQRNELPVVCPGCGALSHETDQQEPGHYTRSRKAVKTYLRGGNSDNELPKPFVRGIVEPEMPEQSETVPSNTPPMCDRCHDLVFSSKGTAIAHPSLQDIADSIAESPFTRNHVYHVLDAADFPMSLIPSIYDALELAKPRSQNRRSQQSFSRKSTVSFIITRSDLLAPNKAAVDRMKPYFESLLRTALGRIGRTMRLGNVHLVSAKRGWWTTEIKSSIWERGGGNWMVGKFNVGKSNLFEVLFPKGSGERAPVYAELREKQTRTNESEQAFSPDLLQENSLLPPLQPETPFPVLPLVSSLPGTTASPIRLSFGGHRGELIDLPGLARGDLNQYVQPEHQADLVMMHRPNVEQHNVKPGQSLILGGGLIRITPFLNESDPSTIMMAYPFVPIDAHVTSTSKAIAAQLQERESGIDTILTADAGAHMTSAGVFELNHDVTKYRAGPLLRAGVDISRLPFRVYSTEIVIQGVGWVELVCQIRTRRGSISMGNNPISTEKAEDVPILSGMNEVAASSTEPFKPLVSQSAVEITSRPLSSFPQIEIFSPKGQHVLQRRPLGAWQVWEGEKRALQRGNMSARPRKSMKGSKQLMKQKIGTAA